MVLPQLVHLRRTLRIFYAIRSKLFLRLVFLVVLIFSVGFFGLYFFEYGVNDHFQSPFDLLYFLVTTISTVGFGDKFALTVAGKVVVIFVILMSVFLIASVSALSAAVFLESHLKEELGMKSFSFKKHFVVLGWNLKGPEIVDLLLEKSEAVNLQIVLIADLERKPIDSPFLHFVRSTYPISLESLQKGNIAQAKEVIILGDYQAGSYSDALIASHAVLARSETKEARIHAELLAPKNKALLKASGVDRVIGVGELGGRLLAGSSLDDPKVSKILEELT